MSPSVDGEGKVQTLVNRVASYLDHCREIRRLSEHTLSAYRIDLGQFCAAMRAEEILTASAVRGYLTSLAEGSRYSVATIRRKFAAVRAFLKATDEQLALETFGTWKLKIR